MSIRVMNHVWGNSKQQGSALVVLLAIADWARDDGHNAYPTIPMLADKARLSHRSAQRIIANLEESGELVIQRSTGRGHAHVYSVPMDIKGDILSPDKNDAPSLNDKYHAALKGDTGGIERVTSPPERVTPVVRKGDTPRITNRYLTVNQPSIEPSREESDVSSDPPPDWFRVLSGFPKFKTSLADADAWLSSKGISLDLAERTAYGVKDFVARPKNKGRDPWATFQNWARRDAVSPRSRPPPAVSAVNSTDYVAMKAAQAARRAEGG